MLIPAVCLQPLSATNLQGVANFIWSACPQLLNWPHDSTADDRAIAQQQRARCMVLCSITTHPLCMRLKAGRPDGGIPSGALIIKQMYNDNNGQPGAVNGWTIIVKKKDASYDGWFWGYVDPQKQNGGDGLYGGQFYDPNCVVAMRLPTRAN